MNEVILKGNITKDLELRSTSTQKHILEFTIAVNDGFGEYQRTDFVRVTAWEKLADNVSLYCAKGSPILVRGKLRVDQYEKDGITQYKTYVLAQDIEFLGKKKEDVKPQQQTLTGNGRDVLGFTDPEIDPSEIPFY